MASRRDPAATAAGPEFPITPAQADALTPPTASERLARNPKALAALALAALGVVFGDIGTSPLYALQTVFSAEHNAVEPSREDVFGVVSMVFWAVTIVVSYGYAALIMRADNDGEGGILSLVALLRRHLGRRPQTVAGALILGVVGAGLFYGDSLITPAISVMSAIEGLSVVDERFHSIVLPLSLVILAGLFSVQRFGSGHVGRFFGPIMAIWFVTLAALGIPHVLRNPEILWAVSPHHALVFGFSHPGIAFIAAGAVVLTVTGVEAMYADMGHFGPRAIRLAWFLLVFPALMVNYMGQGAEILRNPATAANPFFLMAPEWARIPLVVLATMATIIASQAVISGAFSVSRQAVRAGLLPRLNVQHTSKEEGGQIYIGSINWILFVGIATLILVFRSAEALASAYGLAVTGTLLIEMGVFLVLARLVWGVAVWKIAAAVVLVLGVEAVFFAANMAKLLHGGWLPLAVAGAVVTVMLTWRSGSRIVEERRREAEGSLSEFIEEMRRRALPRVPGLAVFPHSNKETIPLALRQNVEFNRVLHDRIAIVTIVNENVPHIRHVDRAVVDDLGYLDDGIIHISYHVGFNDSQHVPRALDWARDKSQEVIDLEESDAHYFISTLRLTKRDEPTMPRWQRAVFLWLARNSADRTTVFHLPRERSVVIGGRVEI
ncbi:potassium transporter Kup [Tessaracoccus oleiagri]|uniref:Probable potassium transport system protein Kup n=1 Tax=Tessaracoccus oleiagri TaxID=686624 RepID=A0A1G9MG30_9ACTN|nr:potassium transporter Kup [Tessaracoccus oleiagri]SDL72951.1 KUP system potassium uptake protein [Tessaracoccus oleiagri]